MQEPAIGISDDVSITHSKIASGIHVLDTHRWHEMNISIVSVLKGVLFIRYEELCEAYSWVR